MGYKDGQEYLNRDSWDVRMARMDAHVSLLLRSSGISLVRFYRHVAPLGLFCAPLGRIILFINMILLTCRPAGAILCPDGANWIMFRDGIYAP